jgi:predicted nucleotidyltransferase
MPELTENQIADLRALQDHCRRLRADLVIIGAIAYQVHFPRKERQTGDIDFVVALDLDEFAELERRLLADRWKRSEYREHRWRSPQGTILDLLPAGPKLREAKQVTWPTSQFTMSLVGFEFPFAPDLTLKVIPRKDAVTVGFVLHKQSAYVIQILNPSLLVIHESHNFQEHQHRRQTSSSTLNWRIMDSRLLF